MKRLITLLVSSIFLLFIVQSVNAVDISPCQTLSSADTVYILTANVSSSGTCFTITANNIILNGNGYNISYNTPYTTHKSIQMKPCMGEYK